MLDVKLCTIRECTCHKNVSCQRKQAIGIVQARVPRYQDDFGESTSQADHREEALKHE